MNIFITGISSGIGRTTAIHLIHKGHRIWGIARRTDELRKLSEKLSSSHFFYMGCDISKKEDMLSVVSQMKKCSFLPDVVIFNAGILMDDISTDHREQISEQTFAVNFHSVMFFVDIFLKSFLERGSGHFIAINTTSALRPNPARSISYSASKAALSMAFKGLSEWYKDKQIYFSAIYLGPIDTSMWEGRRNFLVGKKEGVSRHIETIIWTKKSSSYYPRLSTTLFRLASWIPDSIFFRLSRGIMK
jgi:short-subunit dehydrogenase